DDKHILWNDSEKSVTVSKDSTKINLKVDSKTAYVNGSPVSLDVAPVNYKNRVYIPARFVSQSLGKKVAWDGASSSVIIRDEKDFNSVKDILDKTNKAMANVTKLKLNFDGTVSVAASGKNIDTDVKGSGEIDIAQKKMHMLMNMKMSGQDIKVDTYITNKGAYLLNPLTNKWQNIPVNQELLDKSFQNNGGTINLEATDTLAAGLVADTTGTDEIVLKGDVYMGELFKTLSQNVPLDGVKFNKLYMEIHIDKKTYYTTKANAEIAIDVNANTDKGSQKSSVNEKINFNYSDYNGDVNITLPDDIK
ncbi:MAG TPA: copper amine oxidase N-terminal domain-containing protein, partial [Clostridia bacterium]